MPNKDRMKKIASFHAKAYLKKASATQPAALQFPDLDDSNFPSLEANPSQLSFPDLDLPSLGPDVISDSDVNRLLEEDGTADVMSQIGSIGPGSKGKAVKEIQEKLASKGYSVGRSGSDGVYGKNLENAILYFKVLNDIEPVDGLADSQFLRALNSGNFIGPNDTREPHPEAEKVEYTEKDLDAIARGIIVETGFRANYREIAGIIWIIINRSKRWNMPLYKVIDPDTGGGKNWYGRLSDSNRKRWNNAHKRKDFSYIKNFVKQILDGASFRNEIGNRAHFLHPGGMPKCDEEPGSPSGKGGRRICVDTGTWGKRSLPKWNIDGNTNMAGTVDVLTIGNARFS